MKPVVIYKSVHHDNTEKIASVIADVLDAPLYEPHEVESLDKYDLVGFGSGIYYGTFHREILEFIDDLSEMNTKKAFIFSTSGLPEIPIFHAYSKKLQKKLEKKRFIVIGTFSCRGYDTSNLLRLIGGIHKGRPNEEDLEGAREFAEKVEEKY